MAFSLSFKNLGHYFAVGFKYVAVGISDVVKVAAKAQVVEPEVDALVGALAGPQAAAISDLAFHTLGSVAAALQNVGTDATAQVSDQGLNIQLDTQTVQDIKTAAATIEAIIKSVGGKKPA
jgi:hypothetical protein